MHLYLLQVSETQNFLSPPSSTHHRMLTSHPQKPLNDNVFHLSDSFLCYVLCSAGNAESSNLVFFGSLFIKYAVLLFVDSLSTLCFVGWFNFWSELGNNVSPLRCVFCVFNRLCFQLLDFFRPRLNVSLRFIVREARTNVFMNFVLNNSE
jgi:hypothetical protein